MDWYWWPLLVAAIVIFMWRLPIWAPLRREVENEPMADEAPSASVPSPYCADPDESDAYSDDQPTLWEAEPARRVVPQPTVEIDDETSLWAPRHDDGRR